MRNLLFHVPFATVTHPDRAIREPEVFAGDSSLGVPFGGLVQIKVRAGRGFFALRHADYGGARKYTRNDLVYHAPDTTRAVSTAAR